MSMNCSSDKLVMIRGTIRRVGKRYVSIYVHADYADKLIDYMGKKVVGLIVVDDK